MMCEVLQWPAAMVLTVGIIAGAACFITAAELIAEQWRRR